MRKKILITGAGGFLGYNLVKECISLDRYEIWASTSNEEKLLELKPVEFLHVVDRDFPFSEDFKAIDFYTVVNCAFPRGASEDEVSEGVDYTKKLFECIENSRTESVINISSQSVYGSVRESIVSEESAINPAGTYARGKIRVEKFLPDICRETTYTNIRLASLIGPDFDNRVVNKFIKAAIDMQPITVVNNNRKYAYLDVADAVNGLVLLMDVDYKLWKKVYNLGPDGGKTVFELLDDVHKVFDYEGRSFPEVTVTDSEEKGTNEILSDLLRNDTGYKPQKSIAESVESILINMVNE